MEVQSSSSQASMSSDSEKALAPPQGRVIDRSWKARMGVVCAGVALMCDGYFNNLMSPTNLVFTKKYPEAYDSTMSTRVSNSLLIGEVIGMLAIGLTCDSIGRKASMILTTVCMVVGGILATAAHGKTTTGMFWMIVVMRGVIGFGSGGEYPASSTAASESANESVKKRGRMFILVTNLPLSLGGPFCFIVFLIVWEAARGDENLNTIWRVMFGIGCIWPVFIFYFRLTTMKSEMFSKTRFINWDIPWWPILKYYWRPMLGTCGTWFLYDWVSFGGGVWSGMIIESVTDKGDTKKVAEWQLLVGVIAIPGVIVGAFCCEWIGRKYTLIIGFAGYLVFGLIIGCGFEKIKNIVPLFIIFYGVFNSFGNMGPGDMMGLLSSELYATPVRGTMYGFSAAVGKAGGAVGTQVFHPIQHNLGVKYVFIIAACIGVAGILITIFFIPNRNDDDLASEDARFYAYLRSQGWSEPYGDQGKVEEIEPSSGQSIRSDRKKNADNAVVSVTTRDI